MKINIHNIFRATAVLAVSILPIASCMQLEEGMDEAVGYLCSPSVDVDVTVENLIDTKALDGLAFDVPAESELHYLVKDKDGNVKHDAVGFWPAMAMPVGKYSVEAYHGVNGFGTPYFYGKTGDEASIRALEQEIPELTASLRNAVLRVNVDSDFARHFSIKNVVMTPSGQAAHTVPAEDIANWYFVPSGVTIEVKIVGQSSAGVEKVLTQSITTVPKSSHEILCKQDGANVASISLENAVAQGWGGRIYLDPATQFTNISDANKALVVYEVSKSGNWDDTKTASVINDDSGNATQYYVVKDLENTTYSLRARIGNLTSDVKTVEVTADLPQPTVTLAHNNNGDSNVMLTGTNATINLNLPEILSTLYGEKLLQANAVLKKGTDIVRTSGVDQGLMEGEITNWPYLPQGSDYALTVDYSIPGEAAFATTSVSNVKSDAPVFKVTLDQSYSSYDYGVGSAENGITKDINFANTLTGAAAKTIFGVKVVSWGVSSDLLSKYGGSSTDFKYDGTSTSIPSTGTFTEQSLGEHTIYAKTTFDNVSAEATRKHYITGLPYSETPPKEGNWTKLKGENDKAEITFNSDHVYLFPCCKTGGTSFARITSNQKFYLPESVNVRIINDYDNSGSGFAYYSLRFGDTALLNRKGGVAEDYDATTTFAAGEYNVQMESYYNALNTSGLLGLKYSHKVKKIEVLYGE